MVDGFSGLVKEGPFKMNSLTSIFLNNYTEFCTVEPIGKQFYNDR